MTSRPLAAAFGILVCAASAEASAADRVLAKLEGEWIGRGTVKRQADATPEVLYCRITNKLVANGMQLQQTGRCAAGNQSGATTLTLESDGAGRYSGLAKVPGRADSELSGRGTEAGIDLLTRTRNAETGEVTEATIRLQLGSDRYGLVTTVKDAAGRAYDASTIVFTRQ